MKVNEVIKMKRKELGLTQEYLAKYLGVSIPAISKWEKGTSYPDITLLPILARLLKVDLNTLLCFTESLTELEVKHFVDELSLAMEETGDFEAVFQLAIKKIHEYPSCDLLMNLMTNTLERFMFLYAVENRDPYDEILEEFYNQLMTSTDARIKNEAISLLVGKYMFRKEYEKAEALINEIPDSVLDKRGQQANLYIQQGRFLEATLLQEEKLLSITADLQFTLLGMVDLALKEVRFEDANYYAELYEKTMRIYYPHVEFNAYFAHLQIAIAKQDEIEGLRLLRSILKATKKSIDTEAIPYYRNNAEKRNELSESVSILANQITNQITNDLNNDGSFEFLRKHPGYNELAKLLSE